MLQTLTNYNFFTWIIQLGGFAVEDSLNIMYIAYYYVRHINNNIRHNFFVLFICTISKYNHT